MTTVYYASGTGTIELSVGRTINLGFKPDLGFTYVGLDYDSVAGTGTRQATGTDSPVALTAPQIANVETLISTADTGIPQSRPLNWTWFEDSWVPDWPIGHARKVAIADINEAADRARKRYATDITLIGDIFAVKWQQVKDYIASGGTIPPYLQAELDARGLTSGAALSTAEEIRDAINTWHDTTGADIERERRIAVLAIQAATTQDDVNIALASGIDVIDQL